MTRKEGTSDGGSGRKKGRRLKTWPKGGRLLNSPLRSQGNMRKIGRGMMRSLGRRKRRFKGRRRKNGRMG